MEGMSQRVADKMYKREQLKTQIFNFKNGLYVAVIKAILYVSVPTVRVTNK